jgi:glycosyltransferase involved in cell wall biosynthesis
VNYHAIGPSLFSFIPRLCGKKTVVTVQGLDWQRKKWGKAAKCALRLAEASSAAFPDRTVAVSRVLEQHYHLRHAGAACDYVPNGTRIRGPLKGALLRRLGLEPGGYVLFTGRFSPEKNCHLLIEAFEKLDTPMTLVLAGGASHIDTYVGSLRRRQSERIKILDWLSGRDLEEMFTNAALFVLPSDVEGMSLALLDAMGASVCVLASDIPENLEAIGGAGFTFKSGDVDDLRSMLEVLLSNQDLRAHAGRLAQQRVRQNYLWDTVAAEISSVYYQVLGRQPQLADEYTSLRKVA